MKVRDPLTELLAIKLYEHDLRSEMTSGGVAYEQTMWPPHPGHPIPCWAVVAEEDREVYRRIARGELEYGKEERE